MASQIIQMRRDKEFYNKLSQYKKYFQTPDNIRSNPLQTWVIVAHYKWTVGILTVLFTCIVSSWFSLVPMECVSKTIATIASKHPDQSLKDLCLSYSYTSTEHRGDEKIYILHYRWIHWAVLCLIPIYSIPLLCRKYLENSKIFTMLNELEKTSFKDNIRKHLLTVLVDDYSLFSGWVLHNLMILHWTTLLVDIVAFAFIDILLQNKFARLFPLDYPFHRMPQHFNDTLSLIFPRYVECYIGPEMKLLNNMVFKYGCELPLTIYYDKVFVVMWVFMAILTLWTMSTIAYYILLILCPCLRAYLIHLVGAEKHVKICVRNLPTGCILTLQCFKNILNTQEYRDVLDRVSSTMQRLNREREESLRAQYLDASLESSTPKKNPSQIYPLEESPWVMNRRGLFQPASELGSPI